MIIWCVEDDESIRDIEIYTLQQTGFDAKGFEDGKALRIRMKDEKPDLIILDVMLPGEDGIEILKRLRESPDTSEIPVIMATAKGTEYDKIQGLDTGADDYLVKPFGMMEMVSRVRAVLRRTYEHGVEHLLQIKGLVVNLDEHTVTTDGTRVLLTYKEYELLKLFLSNTGKVFTREQLFDRI